MGRIRGVLTPTQAMYVLNSLGLAILLSEAPVIHALDMHDAAVSVMVPIDLDGYVQIEALVSACLYEDISPDVVSARLNAALAHGTLSPEDTSDDGG